jgi:hypothetical protein
MVGGIRGRDRGIEPKNQRVCESVRVTKHELESSATSARTIKLAFGSAIEFEVWVWGKGG